MLDWMESQKWRTRLDLRRHFVPFLLIFYYDLMCLQWYYYRPDNFQQKKMKKKYLLKTPSQPTFQHLQYSSLLNRSSQADPQGRATHIRATRPLPHRLKTEPPPCQPPNLSHSKKSPSSSNLRKGRYFLPSSNKQNQKNGHSNSSKKTNLNRLTYNQYRASQFVDFQRSYKMDTTLFNNRLSESKHRVGASLQKQHKSKYCLNQQKHKEKGPREDSFEMVHNLTQQFQMYRQKDERKKQNKQRVGDEGTVPQSLKADDVVVEGQIGSGTFGTVYSGRVKSSGAKVAVKKVQQQKKYKTRQLQMVKMLESPFIVRVYTTYTSQEGKNEYLNIIMESFELNFFEIMKKERPLAPLDLKCYAYQMIRGLMYIHGQGVCHRDLKPQNMLVKDKRLVICDFGSAKILRPGEQNISYICSRCYRAPQLIFQSMQYTTQIDMWSLGCIFLEAMHGRPLFIADSSLNHILEVIKVMGTPTKREITAMNPHYEVNDYDLPLIPPKPLKKLFPQADLLFLDLTQQLVKYDPQERLTAPQALAHPYFDQLRDERSFRSLSKTRNIDYFFNFQKELVPLTLKDKLTPKWFPLN